MVLIFFDEKDAQGRHKRRMMSGDDYYAMDENGNLAQSFEDYEAIKDKGHILYGKWTTDENIDRIDQESFHDRGEGWLIPEQNNQAPPPKEDIK